MLPYDYPASPWIIAVFVAGLILICLTPQKTGGWRITTLSGLLTCLATLWFSQKGGQWPGMMFWTKSGSLFGGSALIILGLMEGGWHRSWPILLTRLERLLAVGLGGFWAAVALMSVLNGYPLSPGPIILTVFLAGLLLIGRSSPSQRFRRTR